MPGQAQHLVAARTNTEFAKQLMEQGDHLDWAVVAVFYSALHWVDSFLARQQIHPLNHEDRDRYVRRTQLRQIYNEYRRLRLSADESRYSLKPVTGEQVSRLIEADLAAIRDRVEALNR